MVNDIRWGSPFGRTTKSQMMHAYKKKSPRSDELVALCGYRRQPTDFAKSQQILKPMDGDCGKCWSEIGLLK